MKKGHFFGPPLYSVYVVSNFMTNCFFGEIAFFAYEKDASFYGQYERPKPTLVDENSVDIKNNNTKYTENTPYATKYHDTHAAMTAAAQNDNC